MPNRILKESIWRSESLNQCSLEAQGFFMRLIPYPDDFGRFDARIPIIRASLYPLRYAEVTEKRIEAWLQEIVQAGMIRLYEVNGVRYGHFVNWDSHQRQRTKKSRYPQPPTDESPRQHLNPDENAGQHLLSDDNKCPDESESEIEIESESKNPLRPTFQPDGIEVELSTLLFEKIQERNPNQKKPNLQIWARDIHRMIELDSRDPTDIRKIIEWCQGDPFWQNNILSTLKLRQQYDQLWLKMQKGNGHGSGNSRSPTAAFGKAKSDGEPYPVEEY
jgi:hypothetical protein